MSRFDLQPHPFYRVEATRYYKTADAVIVRRVSMYSDFLPPEFERGLTRVALRTINEAGFQAPSAIDLAYIIERSFDALLALDDSALRKPTKSELVEFFKEFVLHAVNRAPGIGDAASI